MQDFILKNKELLFITSALLFVLFATDGFATPNSGNQGPAPSGSGRGSQAPAPFGLLFVGFGAVCASFLKKHLPKFRMRTLIVTFALIIACTQGMFAVTTAFLLAAPLFATELIKEEYSQTVFSKFQTFFYAPSIVIAFLSHDLAVYGLVCSCFGIIYFTRLERSAKTVLIISLLSSLVVLQPFVAYFDLVLQEIYTTVAVSGLQMLGLPAVQNGNIISGLALKFQITQACVGSSVIANTLCLVCFVTALFVKADRQILTVIQMSLVVLCLNAVRIIALTYASGTHFTDSFDALHLYTGAVTAFVSYALIGAWVYGSKKRSLG